ncbi:hypothetical protein FB451DRAFT_1358806 [Mycena latifolia]|nr:hypothetical protein FB451DRAFT_1358806 [Mycena latifolia]
MFRPLHNQTAADTPTSLLIPYHNMLQIPSSVFSLFSLSSKVLVGLCGGLFIGSKVAVTQFILSIPKDSFPATRTTEIVLLPTKCVLSSPKISFSCISILAYATFIFASVICILRAKGFTRASNDVASQPPSPPPEPGSSCGADKKRGWAWLFWLLAILLGLVFLGLAGFYMFFGDQKTGASLPAFAAHSIRGLSFIERSLFDGLGAAASFQSTVKLHISMHSWQYSKIILLALASHSMCALVAVTLDRLRRCAVAFAGRYWMTMGQLTLVPIVISGTSWLNWLFWIHWYWLSKGNLLPTVLAVHQGVLCLRSRLSFLETYESVGISMVVGPAIIHAATMGLWTVLLALLGIPCTATALSRELSDRSALINFLRTSLSTVAFFVTFFVTFFGTEFLIYQYTLLRPDIQQLVWRSFVCPRARSQVRTVFWFLVGEYEDWKSTQIKDFRVLVSALRGAFFRGIDLCLDRWVILCWGHRLLIVAPVVILYAYFYVIPAASKVRIWRRRRRRCGSIDGDIGNTTSRRFTDDNDSRRP